MLDFVMFMNKRRLMLGLLIAAIVFMILYAVFYPKTIIVLRLEEPDGARAITYRVNSRGTVTVLWDQGEDFGSSTVRLSREDFTEFKRAAAAVPFHAFFGDEPQRIYLEVEGRVLRNDATGIPGGPIQGLVDILERYTAE